MPSQQLVSTYCEVRKWTLKRVLRHIALSVLSNTQKHLGLIDTALQRPRVQFVYLHHVFKDEEKQFSDLVKWLLNTGHIFVSYSEAVKRIVSNDIDKPYISFSFDDGLKSCVKGGMILKSFGIPACFFLNDFIIDCRDADVVSRFSRERLNMPRVDFLNWSDVETLMEMGHEIGGHTTTHINMACVPGEKLCEEVEGNLSKLKKNCGIIKHFSWPYGLFGSFSESAKEIVYNAGYETCASAEPGCHVVAAKDTQFCIRRGRSLAAGWPLGHLSYFIARNARIANEKCNLWWETC